MISDKSSDKSLVATILPLVITILIVLAGCFSAESLVDEQKDDESQSRELLSGKLQTGESRTGESQSSKLQTGESRTGESQISELKNGNTQTRESQFSELHNGKSHTEALQNENLLLEETPESDVRFKEHPIVDSPISIRLPIADMRVEVNITSRKLYIYSGDFRVASHPVAVGRNEWPTRTGNWNIYAVVWNPWWHPPDEEWAWGRPIMAPGDPDNPLGRAQLVYDSPRSIHGTNDPASIGRAVSHGSIRVANDVAMELARQVMEAADYFRDDEWFERIRHDQSRHVLVELPKPVPIRVYRGR